MSQHDDSLVAQARSLTGEVPFEPGEIFYSRTDKRGVIIEGNRTFRRVSGYGWSELKGAPHKLVRHPDMPKGVFSLFWQRLQAGKRMVAYVKNRSKDGRYYWVLALTWPIEEGYLSVRIKPTSDLFAKVQALYADLREAEKTKGLLPEQSAELLLKRIGEMGYRDYESFMADALTAEVKALKRLTGEALSPVEKRFFAMDETIGELNAEIDSLVGVIHSIRTVPMNMRILASRLENAGGPISAISVNYSQMLEEMSTWVQKFVDGPDSTYARIHAAIMNGQFLVCASSVQSRMSTQFAQDLEGIADATRLLEDKGTLEREAERYQAAARDSLKLVDTEMRRLGRSVLDMKRYVTGLSSTRMMCKIESAALAHEGKSLAGIVEQLDQCQKDIERSLAKVVELNSVIQTNSSMLGTLL
ncbi:PAS domain-containing protein [Tropicibacter alexandrii]|uniref:PAS domain-containing protein n=1 Tax=Tropicibacter alexandrii TaxID=2267683 RepID=UPI000EF448F7|nr:PAS domain-containing protein [Tropicibacter alexandrii]